jgi:hypothetical protein
MKISNRRRQKSVPTPDKLRKNRDFSPLVLNRQNITQI